MKTDGSSVYFFVGLISGALVNTIGPKWTLFIGTFGYPIYAGGLWYCESPSLSPVGSSQLTSRSH